MTENLDFGEYSDRIAELYTNKTIFITGGTGFIGKVLIEKLLRSCSGLKKIILIVRTKKDKAPDDRLKILTNDTLFNLVKKQKGEDIMKKVVAISGDMMAPGLGLSVEDREMLKREVEIIFHCAANVRFDEPLKYSILLNVGGTQEMITLAKECKKLKVFTHVSTAYCHPEEKILYEKVYPPPADPHTILEIVVNKDNDEIEPLAPRILGDYPNTYTFAKALSEKLVADEMENLPIVIARPSVVVPIWKEPIPGWTDNINGPIGLLIAAGKGVLRTMYCNSDTYSDFLPVDVGVNGLLVIGYDYITNKKRRIYNLTSSSIYKMTWAEIIDLGRVAVETRVPFDYVPWYPGGSMTKCRWYHLIRFYLFHLIPAIFVDSLLFVFGFKPVLLRVQKRIYKGYDLLEYYANTQWDFSNDSALEARDQLNPKERQIYKLDGDDMNYLDYFTSCIAAARLYILKEKEKDIPSARRHLNIMWGVDLVFKTIFVVLIIYNMVPKLFNGITRYWDAL